MITLGFFLHRMKHLLFHSAVTVCDVTSGQILGEMIEASLSIDLFDVT